MDQERERVVSIEKRISSVGKEIAFNMILKLLKSRMRKKKRTHLMVRMERKIYLKSNQKINRC